MLRAPGFLPMLSVALFLVAYFVLRGFGATGAVDGDWVMLAVDACALRMAFLAGTRPGEGKVRLGWLLMAGAFASELLADLYYLINRLWLHGPLYPSWSDVGYIGFYVLLFVALLVLASPSLQWADVSAYFLDGTTLIVAVGMIVWHVMVQSAQTAETTALERLLATAYPTLDVVLVGGALAVLLSRHNPRLRPTMWIMTCGLLLYVVADLGYAYLNLEDVPDSAAKVDDLWIVGKFLMAVSVQYHLWRSQPGAEGEGGEVSPRESMWASFLPFLAVAASFGLLYYAPAQTSQLLNGTLVVTLLFVIRQALLIRQNGILQATVTSTAERMRAQRHFRSLVQNASDVVTITDREGIIQYQSEPIRRVFGYTAEQTRGLSLADYLHPDDRHRLTELMAAVSQTPGESLAREWRFRHANGSWRDVETTALDLTADESVAGIVFNTRDITERKALEQRIIHQAYHDSLTNLANRAFFNSYLERMLAHLGCHPVTVLFLDLDDFKRVNDSLGHLAGDQLLVAVADRLRTCAGGGMVGRLGGDEFAMVLTNTDAAGASAVAQAITEALRPPLLLTDREVSVCTSIGLADSRSGETADDLLRNADTAMYRAKSQGKGRVQVYEPGMHSEVTAALEMDSQIRRAVAEHQFVVHYQPTVQMESGRLTGVEALIRWQHPSLGLIPPGEFVPLAESSGLIVPIGLWVLEEACRQAKAWLDAFPQTAPTSMGVNLSARQLTEPSIVSDVARVLAETGLPPEVLMLEITESVLIADSDGVIRQRLSELKSLGVRLAIDDFGTGYSSLSYLQNFPVDVLKIDRSFVAGVGTGVKDQALVRCIVELAKALQLHTVAEGVEDRGQVEWLTRLQCRTGQGYFFSRPVPAESFAEWLTDRI